jgi:hypothetical protein
MNASVLYNTSRGDIEILSKRLSDSSATTKVNTSKAYIHITDEE